MIKVWFSRGESDRKPEQLTLHERWVVYRAFRRCIDPLDGKLLTVVLMVVMGLLITFIMFGFVIARLMHGMSGTQSI